MTLKVLLASAVLAVSAGTASAATLFFDDFESYAQGAPASISPTWGVSEGSVDVIGTPGPYPWYPGQQIDMNGSGGDSTAAFISTVITGFILGQTYTLSFDYGSNKNSNGDETLFYELFGFGSGSSLVGSVSTSGPVPDLLSSGLLTFVAANEDYLLSFWDGQTGSPFDDDNDQGGPILDNVRVATFVAPVPLPAAAPLLLAGLAGLGMLRRRRRAA